MSIPEINLEQARLIQLAALGLLEPPSRQAVKEDVVAAIRGMGILQIDTINVVARSPYLVLFSRLGDYPPAWLDQSLAEGLVFEHWAHAACFIPIDDFSLNRRFVVDGDRVVNYGSWVDENRAVIDSVLDIVRREGSKRSSDFKSPKESGGWWNRKVEKWALEYWLDHGEVMVAKRENFQRVYDLTDRVLPGWDDSQLPARDNVIRELVIRSVKAMGVARPEWIADYYRLPKRDVARFLPGLLENNDLLELKVKEWDQPALYVEDSVHLLEEAIRGTLRATHTTLLSPFDPLVWDRARARQLFGFDFTIQAYIPADKRLYGYFPLPILHNGALVGRLDAKAHRKDGVFEIRGIFLEPGYSEDTLLARSMAEALRRCAIWHKTPTIRVTPGNLSGFRKQLTDFF